MIVETYFNRLENNRGYSKNTILNYRRYLKDFDKYLKKISFYKRGVEECDKISLHNIDSFISIQHLRKDSNTCNLYIAAIKSFLQYCSINNRKTINYNDIKYIRTKKKKIDSLNEDECRNLVDYFKNVKCKTDNQELIKIRNLIIIQLLLYTWLRVSELASLKKSDIKEEFQIIGKWWERRPVNLYREDLDLIKLYLFMRKDNSDSLLVSHSTNYDWRPLTTVSIEKVVKEWAKKAWIQQEVRPHKLRHTFATNLLREEVNLFHIQKLLWHKSISTTQLYLTVSNEDLRKSAEKLKRY